MFVKNIYKLTYLTIIMLLTGLTSCQWVSEPVGGASDDSTAFRLTLTVYSNTASGNSRAAQRDDDYEEVGNDAENFLNFEGKDYRVVLFDSDGNYLTEFGPESDWTLSPSPLYGSDYQKYMMEIEYKFPDSFSYDELENIRNNGVYVMVVANCQSLDSNFDYVGKFGVDGSSKTLEQLWKNNTTFNYEYAKGENVLTWRPKFSTEDMGTSRFIPMFGYVKINKFAPRYNNGPYSAQVTIPMQRAMSKIEVIDNLGRLGFALEDVTMTDINTVGRVIPDVSKNPDWDQVGRQVTSSSLPANPGKEKPNGGLKFFYDEPNKVWIAYVPEMALLVPTDIDPTTKVFDAKSAANLERTHLNVTINFKDAIKDAPNTTETYALHFAKYDENFKPTIPDDSWNHILRNHIYRFSINNVGITAELELHVVPWVLDEDEVWDYTDHVTVGKMLLWKEGTYELKDDDTGRVLLWIEKDKMLEGEFEIKTPLNARWYARLTPLDDANPNAITFVDENGFTLEPSTGDPPVCLEASGIIEEEIPATIRIKPTNLGNDDESAFRLEFFVENLGIWIRVPMVDVNGANIDYTTYTIVRKANRVLN